MKLKYILGLALTSVLITSCSEDMMDRINKDVSHPSTDIVNAKFQITDAEVATVYSVLCGNYAWYVSSYTEQLFGTGNNQLKNVEVRQFGEMSSSSTFNNEWNATYLNLNNLVSIKKKCADGGVNANNYDLLGMEQTLEALNWGILTDLHGNIPMTECFGDISAPKIDSQKDIYDYILTLLDNAQENLAKGGSVVGSQDVIYKGDVSKWIGLAHALKARYLLHTYGVNKNVLSDVLKEAKAAVDAGFDGANLSVFNGKNADNSWSAYHWSRRYIGSSKTVDDLLVDRKDPRDSIYNYGTDAVGTPGNASQAMMTETLNYPSWLEKGAAYLHLFSKSEIYFILAEVKARLGQDAKSDFETAVKASIEDYFATGAGIEGFTDNYSISDDDITAYLKSLESRYTENPLKEIMVQKYIAQTRDEQLETYNDIRRCRYADGSYYVTLTNPNNTQSGINRWPLRLPYGESDVVSNPNVAAAFGSGSAAGNYLFTDPVWWAGGNK
jgi:hypothetical protein